MTSAFVASYWILIIGVSLISLFFLWMPICVLLEKIHPKLPPFIMSLPAFLFFWRTRKILTLVHELFEESDIVSSRQIDAEFFDRYCTPTFNFVLVPALNYMLWKDQIRIVEVEDDMNLMLFSGHEMEIEYTYYFERVSPSSSAT